MNRAPIRVAVYTDYIYRRQDGVIYAERAFALFLAALGPKFDHLRLIGRLAPDGDARYPLPRELELAPIQHYGSLANPGPALRSLIGSLRQMWRALDEIDLLWALGPYPHAIALVLLAKIRRRPVVLGVRQDWPRYVRMRHPSSRWMQLAADLLEWTWMRLARRRPVVAVGSDLTARYAHAPAVLDITISLMPRSAVSPEPPDPGEPASGMTVLSVGRLDEEKNPLLLADVLALLNERDQRWRLVVCGEGDLAPALATRLQDLGVADRAELRGYVPMGEALLNLYRSSHAMLHVSWTEGFPQVLVEAFATGLPVVATAVGGVRAGVGDAALLVPPGDANAAATALTRVAEDPELRAQLIASGLRRARELSLEAQIDRLASFLAPDGQPARAARTAS